MCEWIFWTGSQCAHRGYDEQGRPIPLPEKQFLEHGKWELLLCNQYWARQQNNPTENRFCANPGKKKTYQQMTFDMSNYGYRLSSPNTLDGGKDNRCCRCRGTSPQSRSGRQDLWPRKHDWNTPGLTFPLKNDRVYVSDDWAKLDLNEPYRF